MSFVTTGTLVNQQSQLECRLILVHLDLMNDLAPLAAYLVVILVLALLVGWEYERGRSRGHSHRYGYFDHHDGGDVE